MGLIHSPSIITDGLVLALDAQNSRSYPGSGTAWTDITYRGNNGTLTNGPTFEPGGPFAGSAGGSVYFDGSGDYLELPQDTAQLSNVDFSVEAWVYPTSSGDIMLFEGNTNNATISGGSFGFYAQRSGGNSFIFYGGSNVQIAAPAPQIRTWNHIAYARTSGTWSCFLNGVRVSTASANVTVNNGASNFPPSINRSGGSSCYIAQFRFLLGRSAYDATLSTLAPPTKPLLPVANTSLLTCQGGAIVDSSSNKFTITRTGDARAVKTAAINLDGTNDYVSPTGLTDAFWQSNWTVSFWVNFDTLNTTTGINDKTLLQHGTPVLRQGLHLTQRNTRILFGLYSDDLSGNTVLTTGTWYNVVFTLNNTTYAKQIYLNGTLDNSHTGGGAYVGTGNNTRIGGTVLTFGLTFDGFMSSCSFYNRALTASEISYNFNAMRNRFGI